MNIYEQHDAFIGRQYRLKRRARILRRTLTVTAVAGLGIIGALIGAWFGKG